jgi:Single-strand binding protein family
MRISLVPRLLPSGRPDSVDDPQLGWLEAGEGVNRAVVSGLLAADPQRDRSREGDPVTILLLSFRAPDQWARPVSTCCEVEVPDAVADRHRRQLRAGRRVWVAGQLTGVGGLWATSLGTYGP